MSIKKKNPMQCLKSKTSYRNLSPKKKEKIVHAMQTVVSILVTEMIYSSTNGVLVYYIFRK